MRDIRERRLIYICTTTRGKVFRWNVGYSSETASFSIAPPREKCECMCIYTVDFFCPRAMWKIFSPLCVFCESSETGRSRRRSDFTDCEMCRQFRWIVVLVSSIFFFFLLSTADFLHNLLGIFLKWSFWPKVKSESCARISIYIYGRAGVFDQI